MLCDICHKKNATVHLTEIINDKVKETHICQVCAGSKASGIKGQVSAAVDKKNLDLNCPKCGLTYEIFRKKVRLGCGYCYHVFKEQLIPFINQVQASSEHCGKQVAGAACLCPKGYGRPINELQQIRQQLEMAIQLEEYEEAAQLRDKLEKFNKNVRRSSE